MRQRKILTEYDPKHGTAVETLAYGEYDDFAASLRRARVAAGLTQEVLADRSGTSPSIPAAKLCARVGRTPGSCRNRS